MKWHIKLGIGLVIAVTAYLIGNWIPLEYLRPHIVVTDIQSPEYYKIVISIISAFVTFFAVIVALFKEDIRKYWNYSKLEVKFADANKVSEKLEIDKGETTSEIGSKHYKAEKYESHVIIENMGNITVKNCEVYLEKLSFTGDEFPTIQNIKINSSSLKWHAEDERKILIPPKGKKLIILLELLEPKNQSLPGGEAKQTSPELLIGGVSSPKEYLKGKWEAHFIVYSDDSKPKSFILELEWNGKWEQRFSEIKKCLNINLKN